MSEQHRSKRLPLRSSLRLRLTLAVTFIVLATGGVGIYIDYKRESSARLAEVRSSLLTQAHALDVALRGVSDGDKKKMTRMVTSFRNRIEKNIGPGHHILVVDTTGDVIAEARHADDDFDEEDDAILEAQDNSVISVAGETLAVTRLKDHDGDEIIMARHLDEPLRELRQEMRSRILQIAVAAGEVLVLIFLAIHFWGTRHVTALAKVARDWSDRNFSARAQATGPSEFRLLAEEFNGMAVELERHEERGRLELAHAKSIQSRLLPATIPGMACLRVVAEYHPAAGVAGDLYDFFLLPQDRVAVAILDVAGHGISAALLTGVVKMSLRYRLGEQADLARAVSLVNEDLLACTTSEKFVTACVGVWDPRARAWTYVAAGHHGGTLVSSGGVEQLGSTGPLLGVTGEGIWAARTVTLSVGDRLFLYTDGLPEAGAPDHALGIAGVGDVLKPSGGEPLPAQAANLIQAAMARSGGRPEDDLTLLAMEVLPE